MNFNLINPIPEVLKDPKELNRLLRKYEIVPYYGQGEDTSHTMLDTLRDLCELSTSHVACKNDIGAWAFASGFNIVKKQIPGLYIPMAIPASEQESFKFIQSFAKYGINPVQLIELTMRMFNSMRDSGNAYLLIRVAKVNSTIQVFFDVLDYEDTAYLVPKSKNSDLTLINTPIWKEDYWVKNPPKIYTASTPGKPFNFKEKSSVFETVLHIKNPTNYFYGRPRILSVLNAMFSEFSALDLMAKVTGTEFVTKTILAFEEINPSRKFASGESADTIFNKRITRLRQITTNEGGSSAKSLAAIEYPHGGQPPTEIKLDVNRDTDYAQYQSDTASSVIYENHAWSKELTGRINTKSGIGGNILGDLFKLKNRSTIIPLQKQMEYVWNEVFNNLAPWIGEYQFTFQFPDIITPITQDNADNTPVT